MLKAGGAHNIGNALAAAAAASAAGASLEDIALGLGRFPRGRRQAAAQGRSARQLDHRRFLQRQSQLGARRDGAAADAFRRDVAGAGRHGGARRIEPGQPRADRFLCARLRDQAPLRDGPLELQGRGNIRLGGRMVRGCRFADAPIAGGAHAGRDGADQGLAHQSLGARRAGAHRRRRRKPIR